MTNTFLTCLVAVLVSMGCHKADFNTYTISSVAEFQALTLSAGDVVVWKDGTYDNVKFTFKGNGEEESPITLRAQHPGKVVLTGTSGVTLKGSFLVLEGFSFKGMDTSVKNAILTCARDSHRCVIRNCSIDGTGTEASTIDTKWVNLYGRQNEVSNCTFTDKRNMGCLFVVWLETGIVPEHKILNNRFTRPYTHYDDRGKARNGQESIRIGTSDFSMQDANCLVQGNHFYNCHGEMAEIISNKSCGNVYIGNVFEDSKGTLTLRHGNRCIVRGNYFTSSGITSVGGVRIIGEDHIVENNVMLNLTGEGYHSALCIVMGESNAALNGYWTVKNAVVRNNVFSGCKTVFCINRSGRSTQDAAPQNVTIEGNTVVCNQNSQVAVEIANPTPESELHWKDNIIYGGLQKGTSLPTVSARPVVRNYTSEMRDIISKAGKTW